MTRADYDALLARSADLADLLATQPALDQQLLSKLADALQAVQLDAWLLLIRPADPPVLPVSNRSVE